MVCGVDIIRLAVDKEWMHKATREIAKYWRSRRGRPQTAVCIRSYFDVLPGDEYWFLWGVILAFYLL